MIVKYWNFYDLKKDMLVRQLPPILRRFDMVQVEKLRKIGKKPENFRKNHVFEANIIAQAEIFRNLRTWPGKAFPCGSVFEILNCRGELGLKKNSRNFYKCRGMSRFGEKKQAQLPMRDGSEQTTSSREPRSNEF